MPEQWKPVLGFEEMYEVSDDGQVRNTITDHVLRPKIDKYGYPVVTFRKDKKATHPTVHKLVALAFIGPPPNGLQVNHKDGNKLNNSVENLEYVTSGQNTRHSFRLGLQATGERHWTKRLGFKFAKPKTGPCVNGRKPRLNPEIVKEIRSDYATDKFSQRGLAEKYSLHVASIRRILSRRAWPNI